MKNHKNSYWRQWRPFAEARWWRNHTDADGVIRVLAGEHPPTSVFRWRYWLTLPCRGGREVTAFVQRGRRGYAVQDTWDLHAYLASVVADSVDYFRANLHNHPAALDEHEWDRILSDISKGFRAAGTLADFDTDLTDDERASLQTAFRHGALLLTEWFPHLWD